jgi:hypothetical protein
MSIMGGNVRRGNVTIGAGSGSVHLDEAAVGE